MLRHSRVHSLLDRWTAEGLIAPEHLPRLRSDLDSAGRLARPVTVLAVVAVLLLLAAALSFLASNWEEMPRLLRLGLICAAVAGSGLVAVRRWRAAAAEEIAQDLPAQMALVLCAGLFGVGLLLVSQMFHFGGDVTGWLAAWAVATLALALAAGTARLTMMLAVLLLLGWGIAPLMEVAVSGVSMAMGWNALFVLLLAAALSVAVRRGWMLELWLGHVGLWIWLYTALLVNAPALRWLGGPDAFMILPVLHGVIWALLLPVPAPQAGAERGWRWAAARLAESQQVAALVVSVGLIQVWLIDWLVLKPPVAVVSLSIVLAVLAVAVVLVQALRRGRLRGAALLAATTAVVPVVLSGVMQQQPADVSAVTVWGMLGLGLAVSAGFLGVGVAEGRRGLSGLAVLALLSLTGTGIGLTGLGSLFFLIIGGALAVLAVFLARRTREKTREDAGEIATDRPKKGGTP